MLSLIGEKYTCVSFLKECIAFLLNLDDITNAFWEKRGLVISDWYFSKGMETNIAGEKVKKGKKKFCSKTMCTHSKWANEQTLKTELHIPFYLSVHAFFYYHNSPKWLTPSFLNMHSWHHPGRAKMLCMLLKMIHKYTNQCTYKKLEQKIQFESIF